MQTYTLKTLSAVFPSRNYSLALSRDLPHFLQDRLAGKDILVLDQPLPPDDTLLVDNEKPPSRNQPLCLAMSLNAGVIPDDLQLRMIAQERVRQLQRIGESLLGEGVVRADPENLDIQLLELLIVDLPGRQVLGSGRTEIGDVELDEDVLLPPELAQANLFPCRARECEVRSLVSDLKCCCHGSYKQQAEEQQSR